MTTEASAPAAGFVATAEGTIAHRAAGSGELSVMEAARSISDARRKLEAGAAQIQNTQAESAEPAKAATAEPELAQANADQPQAAPSEVAEEAQPEELPPIERPKSWAKELDEEWNSYPREAQERIAKREQERDAATRRSQNEAAETRKAVEAERIKAEQARTDYEAKLKGVVEQLTEINNSQFSEIKSQGDLDKLVTAMNQLSAQGNVNDAMQIQAYLQAWQNHQQKLQARTAELRQIEEGKAAENTSKWNKFTEDEDGKFSDSLSEGDRSKLEDRMKAAPEFLEGRGFSKSELFDLWNGKSKLSLRDHRIQSLIHDGLKLREIQSAPLKAVKADVPPVQRPGTPPARSSGATSEIQALEKQLATASGMEAIRLGAKITNLRRSAR